MSNRFEKLKGKNLGALDVVESSLEEKNDEDIETKEEEKVNRKNIVADDDDEKILRSYSLTKRQLKMLQRKKLDEIGLSLSEIVGKAIEAYCAE